MAHVKGKASEIVNRYTISEENYEDAWNALITYYENPRRLVQTHLSALYAAKQMKSESYSSLNRLNEAIFIPLNALKALGRPIDQWGDLLVFMASSRFDSKTFKEWQRTLGNQTDPLTLKQIKEFMETQFLTLENMEYGQNVASLQPNQRSSNKSKGSSSHQTTNQNDSTGFTNKCSFCSGEHYIARCADFKAKSVAERLEFVNLKTLCGNCLGKHPTRRCTSDKTCGVCKRKHHSLLHRVNQSRASEAANSQNTASANSSNSAVLDPGSVQASMSTPVQLSSKGVILGTNGSNRLQNTCTYYGNRW